MDEEADISEEMLRLGIRYDSDSEYLNANGQLHVFELDILHQEEAEENPEEDIDARNAVDMLLNAGASVPAVEVE